MTNNTKQTGVPKKRSQLYAIWFRFKKNRLAMLGLCLLLGLGLMALFADVIVDYDTQVIAQNMKEKNMPPSAEHWFGTDKYGRDQFARIIYGARISLSMGITCVFVALIFGTIIGASAAYFGGIVDNVLMRIMDVFLALPNMLLAICIVAALGNGIGNLLIAMTISGIPRFSRLIRSSILSVKSQEYVEASRAYGSRDVRIIAKHIIPNAIGPIVVQSTLNLASTIIAISGMSFIGLGISPPTPEWGAMLSDGKAQMLQYPHLVLFPGLAIVVAVLALNLVGDGLRDALDPRLKN